jgi:branched-subunit amino acid transport protein
MENREFFIYLILLAGSTYLIRAIPFTLVRKKIKNPFIKSFLYYIPYTVLTAMTFPAALFATGNMVSASVGLVCAVLISVKCKNLTIVALGSCFSVLICEILIAFI